MLKMIKLPGTPWIVALSIFASNLRGMRSEIVELPTVPEPSLGQKLYELYDVFLEAVDSAK